MFVSIYYIRTFCFYSYLNSHIHKILHGRINKYKYVKNKFLWNNILLRIYIFSHNFERLKMSIVVFLTKYV